MILRKTNLLRVIILCMMAFSTCLQAQTPAGDQNSSHPFELRGVMKLQGIWQFSIMNVNTKESFWLKMGKTTHGITPISYDQESASLAIDQNGNHYRLALAKPDEAPLAVTTSTTLHSAIPHKQTMVPPSPNFVPGPPPNNGMPPKFK